MRAVQVESGCFCEFNQGWLIILNFIYHYVCAGIFAEIGKVINYRLQIYILEGMGQGIIKSTPKKCLWIKHIQKWG